MRKLPLIDPGPDRNDTTTENIGNMLLLAQPIFRLETLDIFHREHSQRGGKERGERRKWVEGEPPPSTPNRPGFESIPPTVRTYMKKIR